MQRHFQAPVVEEPSLSVEEQAILQDDGSEAELAFDNGIDALERVTGIAEVANDTILIVNETPELGRIEQDLVSAVADMAVAGTDSDPEEILSVVPGADDALVTEGIASLVKSIWDAIITAIKNMYVGLKHWLTTYFSTLEQNKKHAEALIKKLDGLKGFLPNDKAEISIVDIFHYGSDSAKATDVINHISKQDEKFQAYVLQTIDKQFRLMSAIGEGVEEAYKTYDGTNNDKLQQVTDVLISKFGGYLKAIEVTEDRKGTLHTAPLANIEVAARNYNSKIGDAANSLETKIAYISQVRITVDQCTAMATPRQLSFKNDVTPDQLKAKAKDRLDFINKLIALKGDQFTKLEEHVNKVEKACSDMLNRVSQDNKEGITMAKKMMPLATAYANWATQPAAKLLSNAARHNKFWLSLIEMTSNNYTQKPE